MDKRLINTLWATLVLTLPAAAQSTISEDYEAKSNLGGWTYNVGNENPATTGGNPGAYLQNVGVQGGIPRLSTAPSAGSPFLGDWAAGRVQSIGVDLILFDAGYNPGEGRRLSLVLLNDNDTPNDPIDDWGAYYYGDQGIPNLGTGTAPQPAWRSYDFAVPAEMIFDDVPPGWGSLMGPVGTWSKLMSDIDQVEFTYGHPLSFGLTTYWKVGVDNPRIVRNTWESIGPALPGSAGAPTLGGDGGLLPGSPFKVSVGNALPNTLAYVVLGFSALNLPFEGGEMVPSPDKVFVHPTGPLGSFDVASKWPAGIPSGTQVLTQAWILDPGGPFGFASTPGLLTTAP